MTAEPRKYQGADPSGIPTDKLTFAPWIFNARAQLWESLFGPMIDEMTSDPRTLNLLSDIVGFTEPKVIVEVGTYRGWGTVTLAETLRVYSLPGHVWSCDPVDHNVQELVDRAELTKSVTLIHGMFEDLLAECKEPIDLCYIDASDAHEASLRLRYTRLAREHLGDQGLVVIDDTAGDWKGARTLRRMGLHLPQHRGVVIVSA